MVDCNHIYYIHSEYESNRKSVVIMPTFRRRQLFDCCVVNFDMNRCEQYVKELRSKLAQKTSPEQFLTICKPLNKCKSVVIFLLKFRKKLHILRQLCRTFLMSFFQYYRFSINQIDFDLQHAYIKSSFLCFFRCLKLKCLVTVSVSFIDLFRWERIVKTRNILP